MVGVSEQRQHQLETEPWREKLTSKDAWADAASYTMADLTMLRKELVIGYVVAGVLTVMVPTNIWNDVFMRGHGFWTSLENVVIGPFIAIVSFVCSVGNVPMAAALWKGGISFGGVISFIFADLITLPLLLIYRKYYGTGTMLRLLAWFWAVMAAAGLIVEGIFSVVGAVPHNRGREIVDTTFRWNYTTYLNIGFLAVFAVLYWLYRERRRSGGGSAYALDPVCGMQVRRADAPARTKHERATVYFCSDHCRERFAAAPSRYAARLRKSQVPIDHDHHDSEETTDMALDPVCGMTVDPATAAATRRYDDRNWFFCNPGCAEAFDADPDRYVAATRSADGT
jgi:uncharacterized protein